MTKKEPQKKGGAHQLPLMELWKQVPVTDRQEIARIVAQMIARQILPSERKEGSNE